MSAPSFTLRSISFLRSLTRNNAREWFRDRKDRYDQHLTAPMVAVIEQLAHDFQTFARELVATPTCIYRVYRDTRFSDDKTPLKTNIAANHKRLRAIVESPGFRKTVGTLEGEKLQRVPRGFAAEHPAAFAHDPTFYAGLLAVFRQVAPLVRFLNEPLTSPSAPCSCRVRPQSGCSVRLQPDPNVRSADTAARSGVRLVVCLPPSMAALASPRPSTNRSAPTRLVRPSGHR